MNFIILLFWLSLILFLLNLTNLSVILLYAEITWITLYVYSIITGMIIDDITLLSLTFFILGLAGVEFSVGFILLILFKFFWKTINVEPENFNLKKLKKEADLFNFIEKK